MVARSRTTKKAFPNSLSGKALCCRQKLKMPLCLEARSQLCCRYTVPPSKAAGDLRGQWLHKAAN